MKGAALSRRYSVKPLVLLQDLKAFDEARGILLSDVLLQCCCIRRDKPSRSGRNNFSKQVTKSQILQLVRRIAVFWAAVFYVNVSVKAAVAAVTLLGGMSDATLAAVSYSADSIATYTSSTTIRQSPLLDILGDVTTPRNDTLYLEESSHSFNSCTAPFFNADMYSNAFLRSTLAALIQKLSGEIPFLAQIELMLPVVDCTFAAITLQDDSVARIFYLFRSKSDNEDVYLLSVSLSIQDYAIPKENVKGPAMLATFAFIHDIQSQVTHFIAIALGYPYDDTLVFQTCKVISITSDGYWRLQSINARTMVNQEILTASRRGYYITTESNQSNIKNMYWQLPTDALEALSSWVWNGRAVLQDSWAWVHLIHVIFAAKTLFQLAVLLLVMYRNLRLGRIWIGDAFASISNSLVYRGSLILLSWVVNRYWTLREFATEDINTLSGAQASFYHSTIAYADLLTLHLSVLGALGHLVLERIDPAFAILIFDLGYRCRAAIVRWFPALLAHIVATSKADYRRGIATVSGDLAALSPMKLWTVYIMPSLHSEFFLAVMLPFLCSFSVIFTLTLLRKLYRVLSPDESTRAAVNDASEGEGDEQLTQKRNLTNFEIATGAELQHRFGVLSDYEHYLFIKGMKYASADGIYGNGYVTANGNFLVATEDLLAIALTNVFRLRVGNVFVYEVKGHTVNQTARLVYPQTVPWSDLLRLSILVLS